MPRPILLLRSPSFPFKDHWAIFVPSVQTPTFGTFLQVEGDVRSGFRHDVIRNFDTKSTENNGRSSGSCKLSFLGEVADRHVHDTPASGDMIVGATDTDIKDDVERVAMGVEAPGPSMNVVSSGEGNAPLTTRQVVAFRDCQWWVRKVVEKMVEDGILDQGAIGVLDGLPENRLGFHNKKRNASDQTRDKNLLALTQPDSSIPSLCIT